MDNQKIEEKILRKTNKLKERQFLTKAKKWYEETNVGSIFSTTPEYKSIAIRVVAEYIANLENMTIFNIKRKKKMEKVI